MTTNIELRACAYLDNLHTPSSAPSTAPYPTRFVQEPMS